MHIPTSSSEEVENCEKEDDEDDEQILVHIDKFHHILYGGDQLTTERMRGAKNVRANACRGKERLEGVQPVIEDWHSKVVLLKVHVLSNCMSKTCMDLTNYHVIFPCLNTLYL